MNDVETSEKERIAQLCGSIYDRLRVHIYARVAQSGFPDIRPSHSAVLRNIGPKGARVVDLADRAGITKQSMAYLTDGLASSGYVSVAPDPDDGRAKRIMLTRRGTEAVAMLTELSLAAERALQKELGEQGFRVLRKSLQAAQAALDGGLLDQ